MGDLKYVATIASIDVGGGAIEIADLALLGSCDPRYESIKQREPNLKTYLESFSNPFGRRISPSIVVRDSDLPLAQSDYLTAFRNAIAVSAVTYSRVKSFHLQRHFGIPTTEVFDFYPISPSIDGKGLHSRTASEIGIEERVDTFHGQNTPVVYPQHLRFKYDKHLMEALLKVVEKHVRSKENQRFRTRLLRSLQMAYYALSTPFCHFGDRVDFGVAISLWVSAFETLAHPESENVSFPHVSEMIKRVQWESPRLRWHRYRPITNPLAARKRHPKETTTLPVQVYGRLFHTRNMYLHGTPLPKNGVEFKQRRTWIPLFYQVPALYRSVVLSELSARGICDYPKEYYRNEFEEILYKKASDFE